jgi:hypothetical protein
LFTIGAMEIRYFRGPRGEQSECSPSGRWKYGSPSGRWKYVV